MITELALEWINLLGPWRWAVLGVVLLLVEVLVPGIFLFWFGLAGFAVAVQTALIPLPWQAQVGFFVVYSAAFIWIARSIDRKRSSESDQPHLNKRAEALIGRIVVLDKPMEGGFGQARIDDTIWRVQGADMTEGARVKVTGADGAVLTVESAEA